VSICVRRKPRQAVREIIFETKSRFRNNIARCLYYYLGIIIIIIITIIIDSYEGSRVYPVARLDKKIYKKII
jgi:hypothetical protein